jgi:hypothetical protein
MAEDKKKADKDEKEASVAGRAWNATKEDGDPDWATMPNKELKGKLEFAVDRVRATGIAQTNFEIKAKELLAEDQKAAKDEGPMAVSAPQTALGGTAPLSTPVEEAKPAAKPATAKAKSSAKAKAKSPSAKAAAKTDQSGHVPTAAERAAAAAAEKEAPLRP